MKRVIMTMAFAFIVFAASAQSQQPAQQAPVKDPKTAIAVPVTVEISKDQKDQISEILDKVSKGIAESNIATKEGLTYINDLQTVKGFLIQIFSKDQPKEQPKK